MVTKTKFSIGVLLVIILLSGIIYISYNQEVRIRIDNDKSTFYVFENGRWIISGVEHNKMIDGTSNMYRDAQNIKVETFSNNNSIIIRRTTPYIRGPVIIDTYYFEGNITDKKLFPISHTIELINASGYIYQYEIRRLDYSEETKNIVGTILEFGKNMKVTLDDRYYWGKVYKSGILKVRYRPASDYEMYNIRFFDPDYTTTQSQATNDSYIYSPYCQYLTFNMTGVTTRPTAANFSFKGYVDSGTVEVPQITIRRVTEYWDEDYSNEQLVALSTNGTWNITYDSTIIESYQNISITEFIQQCWDNNEKEDCSMKIEGKGQPNCGGFKGAQTRIKFGDGDGSDRFEIYDRTSAGSHWKVYIDYVGAINPIYSLNSTNSTVAGTFIKHSLFWEDSDGLNTHKFSFCNGTWDGATCDEGWVNDSLVEMTGTSNWSNVSKFVNTTIGSTIAWCYYVNDTLNNFNSSSCSSPFEYETIAPTFPITTTLNLPADNNLTNNNNIVFNCSAVVTNSELVNITLYHNVSGWGTNESSALSGTSDSAQLTVNGFPDGTYVWNCLAWNDAGNSTFASSNRTVKVDATVPVLTYSTDTPSDGGFSAESYGYINVTLSEVPNWIKLEFNGTNLTITDDHPYYYRNMTELNGSITFNVWANDSAGSMSNAGSRTHIFNSSGIPTSNLTVWNGTEWIQAGTFISDYYCNINESYCQSETFNSTRGDWRVNNNGSVSGNSIEMKLNQSLTDMTYSCGDTNITTDSVNLTTSGQVIYSGVIDVDESIDIWCWLSIDANPSFDVYVELIAEVK